MFNKHLVALIRTRKQQRQIVIVVFWNFTVWLLVTLTRWSYIQRFIIGNVYTLAGTNPRGDNSLRAILTGASKHIPTVAGDWNDGISIVRWKRWDDFWVCGRNPISHENSSALLWHGTIYLLRATRGARNPNLQVFITQALNVCSQHSFGLPLRMNGMYKTQFDHARLWTLVPLVIWSGLFWLSVTWNLRKAQRAIRRFFFFFSKQKGKKDTRLQVTLLQKRLDFRSLSPALHNLWLLLVCSSNFWLCGWNLMVFPGN